MIRAMEIRKFHVPSKKSQRAPEKILVTNRDKTLEVLEDFTEFMAKRMDGERVKYFLCKYDPKQKNWQLDQEVSGF